MENYSGQDERDFPFFVDDDKATILTFTGRKFHLLNPQPDEINIIDIAHALGMLCRFTGHTREFYSVAEHSVHVSHLVPPEDAFDALMHDSPEAYVADINRPLKHFTPIGPVYKAVENKVMLAISNKFGLRHEMPASVHEMDKHILYTEKDQLLPHVPWSTKWADDTRPAPAVLKCWGPKRAGREFLRRFYELRPDGGYDPPSKRRS